MCIQSLSMSQHITRNFSGGWKVLEVSWGERWCRHHCIIGRDTELKEKVSSFDRKNIFNADECGPFYKMAPETTSALTRSEGWKKSKDWITVLVCANSDGSEKDPLMFIGNALRPRAFKKKFGADYGLDYFANRKAWMTGALFNEWLKLFDDRLNGQHRWVLLMLENCSSNDSVKTFPMLEHTEAFFSPTKQDVKITAVRCWHYCGVKNAIQELSIGVYFGSDGRN